MNTITSERSMRLLCAALTSVLLFAGWAVVPPARDAQGAGASADYAYAADTPLTELWNRTVTGWYRAYYYAATPSPDGGFVAVGIGKPDGGTATSGDDFLISKYTASGTTQWSYEFNNGGYGNQLNDVTNAIDGGYIAIGETALSSTVYDFVVMKYDESGKRLWLKTPGIQCSRGFNSVAAIADGYIAVGDMTTTDAAVAGFTGLHGDVEAVLVKLGKSGDIAWKKSLSGSGMDRIKTVTAVSDGGFVITGYTASTDYDFSGLTAGDYIAKYDKNGVRKWIKTMPFTGFSVGFSEYGGVAEDASGNLLVPGTVISGNEGLPGKGGYDFLLVKYDRNGTLKWRKTCGGSGADGLNSVMVTKSGDIVAVGTTTSNDGDVPPGVVNTKVGIIIRFDANASIKDIKLWGKNHSSEDTTDYDGFFDVVQLTYGRYAAVGTSRYHGMSGKFLVSLGDAEAVCYAGEPIADSGGATSNDVADVGAKLTVTSPTWTGKEISKIEVYSGETKLKQGTDYTIEVISGSTKKIGVVKIKITGIGKYTGSKIVTIKILPKKATKLKLKAGTKSIKATWKKVSTAQQVTGYIVQYKLKTAKAWKSKTVKVSYKGKTTASYTIKKLKKGKTYQVRVVTYKKIKSGASKGTYKSLPTAVKSKKVTK